MNMADNNKHISDLDVGQTVEKTVETPSQSSVLVRTRVALATWLLALSIGAPTTAQAETTGPVLSSKTASGKDATPTTQDGREFAKLTDKEVDELSRPELKKYYAWKEAKLDTTIANLDKNNTALDKKIGQLDQKSSQLDQKSSQLDQKSSQLDKAIIAANLELGIKASQSIKPLLAQYKEWKKPTVSADLRDTISKIARWELPPPGMQALAQELVTYFA